MTEAADIARRGKIARLPFEIRKELNRRLRDGEPGPSLLRWLNALPETAAALKSHFDVDFDDAPITPQNLSEWRQGGYQDWLHEQERTERIRELADFSLRLAQAAGGSIADGGAAIAGGRIMELLEQREGKDLDSAIHALARLQDTEQGKAKIAIARDKIRQKDEEIALSKSKFKRQTCELFIKWAKDKKALEIANSKAPLEGKIPQLLLRMFGEEPDEQS